MPFSDDEEIITVAKSRLRTTVLVVAIALFFLSLFFTCYCTTLTCRPSIEALLLGWMAMLTNGEAASWLANPFLIITWILLNKDKKAAWICGFLASILSMMFLAFDVIIDNEAGTLSPIVKIGTGYWLWLSSCLVTFFGSVAIRIRQNRVAND